MIEWVPIRVDQDPNVLGYVRAWPDPAVWRAWVLETFGACWHTCASCGEAIRPPEQFYVHESSGEVAHVRRCWVDTGDDTA